MRAPLLATIALGAALLGAHPVRRYAVVLLITDGRTSLPIKDAQVSVVGRADEVARSDSNGVAHLAVDESGWNIMVSHPDYHKLVVQLSSRRGDSGDTLRVQLLPVLLRDIVVTQPDFWRRASEPVSSEDSVAIIRALAVDISAHYPRSSPIVQPYAVGDSAANSWSGRLARELSSRPGGEAHQGDSVAVSFVSRIADSAFAGLTFEDCRPADRRDAAAFLYTLLRSNGGWVVVSTRLRLLGYVRC